MSKKDQKSSDDCTMSWASMWNYFTSSRCTDEQRTFTMKSLNLYDCLDGAMPETQLEIMEFAPKVLLNNERIRSIIDPRVLRKLGWGMQQTKSTNDGGTTDDTMTLLERIKERADQIKLSRTTKGVL